MGTSAAPAPAAAAAAPAPATGDAAAVAAAAAASAPAAPAAGATVPAAPAAAAPAAPAAPVKLDLKLPEKSTLAASVLESTATLASALKLDQDGATKVLGLVDQIASAHAATLVATAKEQAVADWQKSQVKGGADWEKRNTQYQADALKDAELGNGDPKKLEAAAALGQRALAAFFPKEMIDLIRDAGLESHPGLLKGLVKIGKAAGEDRLVAGSVGAPATGKRTADVLYGEEAK